MFKHFLTIFGLLATLNAGVGHLKPLPVSEVKPAAAQSANYLSRISKMGISVNSNAPLSVTRKPTLKSIDHCASLIYKTLENLPKNQVARLKNLTLSFDANARRGLGGGGTIILRCTNVSDQELIAVLVHEMGHILDTGVLQGSYLAGASEFKDGDSPIYNDDKSLEFYRISFDNENNTLKNTKDTDFVSGYAKSNPFEDFAETYNYYILHGNEFRELLKTNEALTKKYNFLKQKIFNDQEFFNGDLNNIRNPKIRNYDTTILAYEVHKFLMN